MRRTVVILLLVALALMLVMATPAFAKTGTKSGGYWAYSAGAQEFALEIHGGPSYIFASAEESPHSGYATTTGKCKVCHAVHGAGITTAVDSKGNLTTEKLLRSKAADSCGYCHLGAGAFAIDPYASRAGWAIKWDSWTNYYSNDSSPPPGVPIWTGDGLPVVKDAAGTIISTNQNAANARSGHSATHGHDNPQGSPPAVVKSYRGCASCHSVHGAQALTETVGGQTTKPNILKNDPAKGTTAKVNFGWGAPDLTRQPQGGPAGYGSKWGPATNQAEFCEDCHDGTKLVGPMAAGESLTKVTPIVSQADFNKYFPSCGANGTSGATCHNSIQTDITESVAQFGAFNNKSHNGRSHIMTTTLDHGITTGAGAVTNVDTETVRASGNGCATCHNIPKYNFAAGAPLQQGATFPHFWPSDELIQGFNAIGAIDGVCIGCHSQVGVMY